MQEYSDPSSDAMAAAGSNSIELPESPAGLQAIAEESHPGTPVHSKPRQFLDAVAKVDEETEPSDAEKLRNTTALVEALSLARHGSGSSSRNQQDDVGDDPLRPTAKWSSSPHRAIQLHGSDIDDDGNPITRIDIPDEEPQQQKSVAARAAEKAYNLKDKLGSLVPKVSSFIDLEEELYLMSNKD